MKLTFINQPKTKTMKTKTMKTKISYLILAGLFGASAANAATIVLEDANYGRLIDSTNPRDGVGNTASLHNLVVGTKANGNGLDLHAGIVFQMTGASAADLLTADFSISLSGGQGTPIYNVDVYATRVSSTSALLASDYQDGTKIMDDFVTTAQEATFANYSLDSTGEANLLSYLQTNWVEDDFVIITLKSDQADMIMGEDSDANYNFGGATTYSAGALDAQLTVTVPEPSSTGLLGLGGLGLILRRKRS